MNKIEKIVRVPVNFVVKHKTPIAFAAGSIITGVLADMATKASFARYDEFIEHKGLVPEFIAYPLTKEDD